MESLALAYFRGAGPAPVPFYLKMLTYDIMLLHSWGQDSNPFMPAQGLIEGKWKERRNKTSRCDKLLHNMSYYECEVVTHGFLTILLTCCNTHLIQVYAPMQYLVYSIYAYSI